jgi:hypothetical protein
VKRLWRRHRFFCGLTMPWEMLELPGLSGGELLTL